MAKLLKSILKIIIAFALAAALTVAGVNLYMIIGTNNRIITEEKATALAEESEFDFICVLGCSAKNGVPSKMLRERLDCAISLYNSGICRTILMSGDHTDTYSEVNVMKKYALDNGVDESDILIDEKGYSTIETVENSKNAFNGKRCVFITQNYHLYRTLYLADSVGIDAYGVDCTRESYVGQIWRDIREVGARFKDFAEINFLR